MASNIQPISKLCVFFIWLSLTLLASADNFYQYEVESLESPDFPVQTSLKLIKRQVDGRDKEKKLASKTQSETDSENSSNNKPGIDPTSSQTMLLSETETESSDLTTTLPLLPEKETVSDYDGTNVSVTNTTQDHHRYYNSSMYLDPKLGMQYWVDFDTLNASITHEMLSQSHRRAATVSLSFDFPFYGHWVRNITIATGGFLYTGDYVHSWLAATQYIAPLMANFDTSMSNHSTIKYMDNGTAFTVQWNNVALQDRVEAGNFSFQVTLLKTGDIIFAYKQVPIPVTTIFNEAHPVKVGVSDAYIIDRTIFFVRRKTIYEYHKVDLKKEEIGNGTAIYFSALPTCISLKSCDSCISNTISFDCVWCSTADRCSDGMDRSRQEWLIKGCDKFFIDNVSNCSAGATPYYEDKTEATATTTTSMPYSIRTTTTTNAWDFDHSASRTDNDDLEKAQDSDVSSAVGILFLVSFIVFFAGWLFYAYRNPHTSSGQCFIRYRPSQWRWRSGEAHYTAAAIHM